MTAFILTAFFVYLTVFLLTENAFPAFLSAFVVALNPNFLYVQTTALTEPLFMALFTMAVYFFVRWIKQKDSIHIVLTAFFVCLATLTRYDGWFLLIFTAMAIFVPVLVHSGWEKAKGLTILFGTLGGFGVILWFLYNQLIFGDLFYFAFSEFSAKSQQDRLIAAGVLPTKGNLVLSLITYYYAVIDNLGFIVLVLGVMGYIFYVLKNKNTTSFFFSLVVLSPIIFNVVALFLGHSVIYLPEVTKNSWFNVRYGLIALPPLAIFTGYFLSQNNSVLKLSIFSIIILNSLSFVMSNNIITITDGIIGSSQKNVRGLGESIHVLVSKDKGLILASAASHDAILFSSQLPMKEFIHEGTGNLWHRSLHDPSRYAKYIIMRSNDDTDVVSKAMKDVPNFTQHFEMIYDGDFADLYKRTNILTPGVR